MRRRNRILRALAAALLMIGLTGCWDQHPVEFRAPVAGIAIDPSKKPGEYLYTFLFPNVTTSTSSLATTPSSDEFYSIQVQANTLTQALESVQLHQSRTLYLGQVRILCLSTKLPSSVWKRTILASSDSGRFVLTFWILAVPNAAKVLELTPPEEVVPDVAIYRALNCRCQPIVWPGRAWRTWADLTTPGISPTVSALSTSDGTFELGRIAVLGSHVSVWSPNATNGWAYLSGRVERDTMTATLHHQTMTVGLIRGHTRLRVTREGMKVLVTAKLTYSGELTAGFLGGDNATLDKHVEADIAEQIHRAVASAWREAHATDTDPMGFHRLGTWSDARISPAMNWKNWELHTVVRFTLRNEGVMR